MLNKALWKKHYKETKYLIWGFWLVSLVYPLNIINYERIAIDIMEKNLLNGSEPPALFFNFEPSGFISLFQMILLVGIASILLGLERSNQSMDFTLTLPFKRHVLLRSKWSIGVITILSANFVSFIFTSIILYNSYLITLIPYHLFLFYYTSSVIYLIGIYTFSLLIGKIVGNHIGQFVLTWIFLLLPAGVFTLLSHGIRFHYEHLTETTLNNSFYMYETFFHAITMPISLIATDFAIETAQLDGLEPYRFYAFFIPLVITTLFLSTTRYLSKNMRSEHNGKLIIYKPFESLFIFGVVICFYLLGGTLITSIMYPLETVVVYHIGGLIAGGIAFVTINLLLNKNIRFKGIGGVKNV
ncbi:hypothetical protein CIB95_12645 [Lottiidibacillus patelloidae]|uniref:ABC transporter permease n=1 Tax=Lottiidibacillus patelloidae TaxID=2670334 RepID=A0A263BSW1_9BACI|nr:hypothetical protein [Lottiidibacillus patelloidae]OZM56266.1 hypothetical protein CIB95_12645 [Lottiidibacillus patelloidae]